MLRCQQHGMKDNIPQEPLIAARPSSMSNTWWQVGISVRPCRGVYTTLKALMSERFSGPLHTTCKIITRDDFPLSVSMLFGPSNPTASLPRSSPGMGAVKLVPASQRES